MPLTAFSIRLDRIDESLLFQDKAGHWWLSCVCTHEEDAKGRLIVAQSIPKERYAAGERGAALGTWREIGKERPPASESQGKRFDLSKYRNHPGSSSPTHYPPAREAFIPSPQSASRYQGPDNGPEPRPHGFDELGF